MSDSEKTSVPRMILQAVEDFATIVKGEVEIAKKSLTTSVKKLGLGIGFVITAFFLQFDTISAFIFSHVSPNKIILFSSIGILLFIAFLFILEV